MLPLYRGLLVLLLMKLRTDICVTAHSGIINGFLRAIDAARPRYPLVTGGKYLWLDTDPLRS